MDPANSWREEKQSAWLYRALAEAEKDTRIAALFRSLAEAADAQAATWAASARAAGQVLNEPFVLAREELGLNPDDLGSPIGAAVFSFTAFTVGALVPLVPFFLGMALPGAAFAGTAMAAVALFGTGASMSLFTGRNPWAGGARMLGIGAAAGATVFLIGHLIGVEVA